MSCTCTCTLDKRGYVTEACLAHEVFARRREKGLLDRMAKETQLAEISHPENGKWDATLTVTLFSIVQYWKRRL